MSRAPMHLRPRSTSPTAKALTALGILVLVLGGAGFGAALWFQNSLDGNIERIGDPFAGIPGRPAPAPSDPSEPDEAVNILVLGSDSRISAGDPSQWEAGAQRTDAIMLVHLPADRQAAQVVSIPRDSWVPIPGHGEAKINAAFSFGGPSLLIQTVEQLTGIHVDHFVVTDFTSFGNMTDALGGVQIRVPQDIGDGKQVFFTAGIHQMAGEEALKYVRQRHGLVNGDFGRVQRQQNWMRAMLAKVNNNRNDVGTMTSFLTAVSRSVAADDGFTITRMRGLYLSARGLATNDVTFMTAPDSGTGRSADGQSIVVLDHARFDPLMASFAADTATAYVAEHAADLNVLPATVR
ncbi:LytR family transcriptional regulator [Xylanimonas allomyrinae]|uniref:LytR family transcriptional regulator n=1 Tax=Xylanimonas allomyrinae TaxID=2509459 RepID=A0A4P6ELE8_9MICO|nr:LCP family protein [Xylanimonas allomyrinae]QAY63610.1 LytR family transcriptional regulator [Xylanimonas allomyrinae]